MPGQDKSKKVQAVGLRVEFKKKEGGQQHIQVTFLLVEICQTPYKLAEISC